MRTKFDLSGINLKRNVAHEYVNRNNYEIMAVFKCNHNIQFLLGGKDASDRIHYCTKYVTKQQKRLDSVVLMALAAYRRRQERERIAVCIEASAEADDIATARKRVASMVYTMTNRQEVAGPLAALYQYRSSCCYESSDCSYIPLRDIIHQLCSTEEHSCHLINERDDSGSSRYFAVSFLDDYIYRPEKLVDVNVYEFAMHYFRKKDPFSRDGPLPFQPGHPLHHSHSLGKPYKELVPIIQGFCVPYVAETSTDDILYKRSILSLALFKPFRALEDLVGPEVSSGGQWLEAYRAWEPTRSNFVTEIMNHIDDYYCGADRAKAHAEEMAASAPPGTSRSPTRSEEADSDSDCDSLFSGGDFDGDEDDFIDPDDGTTFINPWQEQIIEGDVVPESISLHPGTCPTSAEPNSRTRDLLDVFRSCQMLEQSAKRTISFQQTAAMQECFPAVSHMKKWVKDSSTDCKLPSANSLSVPACDTKVVELLRNALDEDVRSWSATEVLSNVVGNQHGKFAIIAAISRDYTLNQKQHCAFKIIGTALLKRWRNMEDMSYINSNLADALG
jgi:hypothetical protein